MARAVESRVAVVRRSLPIGRPSEASWYRPLVSSVGEGRGSLGETPFGELLVQALDRRWTGALEVGSEETLLGTVELVAGVPVRVLVEDHHAKLGELLVERGLVAESEVSAALEGRGRLLGEALIAMGVLDEATLERVLGLQILLRAVRLAGAPAGTRWRFLPDDPRFAAMPAGRRTDPLRIFAAASETHGDDPARVALVLALLDDAPLMLRDDVKVERFGLRGEPLAILSAILSGRPTYRALVASGVAPESVCSQVVYLLATTRFLRQADDARAAVGGATPSSPGLLLHDAEGPATTSRRVTRVQLRRVAVPRSNANAVDVSAAVDVHARVSRLLEEGPIAQLGLDAQVLADATPRRAEALVDAAVRDRLVEWESAAAEGHLDSALDDVRAALDAARTVLTEPASRALELERLGVEPCPESRLAPHELRELALYALNRQDVEAAAALCERAHEVAPEDIDVLVTRAWVRSHLPRPDLKVLVLELDDVLRVEPDRVGARFYRGMLRRRLGEDAGARQDFERVLSLEPTHAGARAQIR